MKQRIRIGLISVFFVCSLFFSQANCNAQFINFKTMFPDTSKIDKISYNAEKGFLALDKEGNALFEVYPYDNGPDYPSEGLFRIVEDDKIGFADVLGNIIIPPEFRAVRSFQENRAAFCEGCTKTADGEHWYWSGGKWGYIDKTGKVVIEPQFEKVHSFENGKARIEQQGMTYFIDQNGERLSSAQVEKTQWIDMLASAMKLKLKLKIPQPVTLTITWQNNHAYVFSQNNPLKYLKIKIGPDDQNYLVEYDLIPWQNFSIKPEKDLSISPLDIFRVTDFAVVYVSYNPRESNPKDLQFIESIKPLFSSLFEDALDQTIDEVRKLPEKVQVIEARNYRYFSTLQIALPGTQLPEDSVWMKNFPGKMIYLMLTPDIGQIRKRWIKGADHPLNSYSTSAEDELIDIFSKALAEADAFPNGRNQIYERYTEKIQSLFSSANSFVNVLNEKYQQRLRKWLDIEEVTASHDFETNPFGDYQAKRTPDTAIDYMPEVADEISRLPEATLNHLNEILQLFKTYQRKATNHPGYWEDGNVILGASPREYRPSAEELLLAETGNRLKKILENTAPEEIHERLGQESILLKNMEYTSFTFTHADVMGSGRFFYVQDAKKTVLSLTDTEP